MAGARWAQEELLTKRPNADVRVFVIWFNMYPGDAESKWRSDLLTDRRVEHRWDEPKTAGRWFLTNLNSLRPARGTGGRFPQRADALWDAYLLFGREGTWNGELPTGLLSWGSTLMGTRGQLLQDFQFAIGRP